MEGMNITHALTAGIAGLTAAVIALWFHVKNGLKECQEDRRKLWSYIMDREAGK